MFGRGEKRRHWLGWLSGIAAGAAAAVSIAPMLKRRALRATTLLKKDHRVVRGLFWTMQQTSDPSIRKSIFDEIRRQLDVHTLVEEEIFYPAVQNLYTTVAKEQVEDAYRDHRAIKDLCQRISAMDPNVFEFMSSVNELKERIDHHVDIEENEMFPLVHRNLFGEELEDLGRRIRDRSHELKERKAA